MTDIEVPDPGHGTSGITVDIRDLDNGRVKIVLDLAGQERDSLEDYKSVEAAREALGDLPPESLLFHNGKWIG